MFHNIRIFHHIKTVVEHPKESKCLDKKKLNYVSHLEFSPFAPISSLINYTSN